LPAIAARKKITSIRHVDQAADKVALRDANAGMRLGAASNACVDVIDDVDSNLAALGSERCGMPWFTCACSNASATSAGSSHISDKEA